MKTISYKMILRIENCNDVGFIKYLIRYLQTYIQANIKSEKLYWLQMYINSLPIFKGKLRKFISCREIIIIGAYNLVYKKYEAYYEITIDENQKIFGLDAKLNDACRLINYGTMSVQGYPIFSDAFNNVEDNIADLYQKYKRGFSI